jgi:uncharacterized membrane protein (UPF0127 family)
MPKNNVAKTVLAPKRLIFLILVTAFVVVFYLAFAWPTQQTQPDKTDNPPDTFKIGSTSLKLEYATTPQQQTTGLSGRASLDNDSGLLFVFDQPAKQCIWMKDMNFDIDIIWLGSNKKIIKVAQQVSPDTYPESFCSDQPAKYVLEVNAKTAESLGWQIGDQAEF